MKRHSVNNLISHPTGVTSTRLLLELENNVLSILSEEALRPLMEERMLDGWGGLELDGTCFTNTPALGWFIQSI